MEENKIEATTQPIDPTAIPAEAVTTTRKKMPEFDMHPAEMLPNEQPRKQFAILSEKDNRRLKTNGYDKAKEKFKNVYLIRNLKTGKIAELHAASSYHAAMMLGWNPKKVQLLMAHEPGKAPVTPEPKSCEHTDHADCNHAK